MIRILLWLLLASLTMQAHGQSCDLDDEDFTGATNNVPPTDWIRGAGANIGSSIPPDVVQDPAVGLNNAGEFMTSAEYVCAGEVCFDWKASSISSIFEVEISLSQDNSNWIALDTIVAIGSGVPNTYQNICMPLPSSMLLPPFLGRVRWRMIERTSGTFYLENVCVSSSTCFIQPTELRFDEVAEQCRLINTPFSLTVCATDSMGFPSDSFAQNIFLSSYSGPGNLSGLVNKTAMNGCVTFNDLSVSIPGTYVFEANSGGLTGLSDSITFVSACASSVDLRIMTYNLLNFPNGRDDCGSNTVIPARWDTLEKIAHYYVPDVLMVCELQNQFGADQILNESLNSNGYSNYAAAQFVLDQSGGFSDLNNMFYYNADKLTLYSQSEIGTANRDINKYTVYVNDNNLAQSQDTLFIDFYMAHLKAGNDPTDSIKRIAECMQLRNHLDLDPNRNSVFGGDFNMYTSTEEAYQVLLSGAQPLHDPIDTPGDWDSNFNFRAVHTQSTRASGTPSYDCGSRGGCDSRFDFLLISDDIENELLNLSYVPNSYDALGNNGTIYNQSVNDASNTSAVPDDILNALFYMSDHLPVVMELNATLSSPACASNLIIVDDPILSGTYKASISVKSTGRVDSLSSVVFQAADSIVLNAEFEVELGGELEILIGDCD